MDNKSINGGIKIENRLQNYRKLLQGKSQNG